MNRQQPGQNITRMPRIIVGLVVVIGILFVAYKFLVPVSHQFADDRNALKKPTAIQPVARKLKQALKDAYPAPEIQDIQSWINSNPLRIADLRGKVVLVDFWSYSCINCLRTLPYLKKWQEKYGDKGLVIIGVHSPEFDFEKDPDNVQRAVEGYQIPYPVALDNQFATWKAFKNQYWPAHYLIDKDGNIVYQHVGEGNYDETEYNILSLLGEKVIADAALVTNENSVLLFEQTPETYLGYARAQGFSDKESFAPNLDKQYTYVQTLAKHSWSLQGNWFVSDQKIKATQAKSAIKLHFFAKKVYAVMGTATEKPISVQVLLNGKPDGVIKVDGAKLYEVVSLPEPQGGVVELITTEPGLEMYTFTFGN